MAHDVFISYSSKDKFTGDAVCSILEANQIRCWIAPRDVTPGLPFAESLIDAINESKVFVLIFSSNSNKSFQVMKEVERAVHHGIPIIPLRIEDVPMSKQLEFYVSNIHWLDAITPPLEDHINKLAKVVKMILSLNKGEDIKEAYIPDTGKKTDYTKKDKKKEKPLPGEESFEEERPGVDKSEAQEESFTPEASAGKFSLKKLFVPAVALTGAVIVVLSLWIFTGKSKQIASNVDKQPESPAVETENYVKAGSEFLENREYGEAMNQFNKALAFDPANYEAQLGTATILYHQGKLEESMERLQRAIELNDQDPRAFKIMGEIFEKRQELDKAIAYFQKYIQMAPEGQDSKEVRRKINVLEAQLKSTVTPELPDSTKKIEKHDFSAQLKAGIEAFDQKKFDQCIRYMEEILNSDQSNKEARYYLAEAKKRIQIEVQSSLESAQENYDKGYYKGCIEQLEKILMLDPENNQAQKYLNLAKMKLSSQQIGLVIHQYVRSTKNNNLLEFYEKQCSSHVYEQIKKDIQMILRVYKDLQPEISDINIRFEEMDKAEVTFYCLMTGVSSADGKRQILFDGNQEWIVTKEGEEWLIEEINFKPTQRK